MCKISMDRPKLYSFFLTAFSHSLQYTSMSLWAFLKYSLITDSLFHLNIIYMGFLDMFSLIFYLLGLYLSVYIATKISYKSILIYSLLFGSMAFITMPILKWSHYPNLFLLGLIFTVFSFLQGSSFIANGNILVGNLGNLVKEKESIFSLWCSFVNLGNIIGYTFGLIIINWAFEDWSYSILLNVIYIIIIVSLDLYFLHEKLYDKNKNNNINYMSISRLHLIFQNELNLFYDFEENASFEEELSNNEISMRNEEINPNLNNTETYFFEVNNEKAKLGFVEFPSQFSMKYEKKFDFGSIFPKLLLYFMCYGILELIYISNLFWLPMYLKIILGSNIFFIILILTLFEVGQIMGTICLPLLYEMGGKHPLIPIFFSSLMIVLCMFIHFFNDVPPSIYFIYFLLTGIILGGFRHIICYIISMDYKENRVYDFNSYGIGVVAVIVHGFGLLFSAIFQPLIPIFINSLFLFFGILMIFHSFLMIMYAYSTIKRKRSENLLSYDDSEEYY